MSADSERGRSSARSTSSSIVASRKAARGIEGADLVPDRAIAGAGSPFVRTISVRVVRGPIGPYHARRPACRVHVFHRPDDAHDRGQCTGRAASPAQPASDRAPVRKEPRRPGLVDDDDGRRRRQRVAIVEQTSLHERHADDAEIVGRYGQPRDGGLRMSRRRGRVLEIEVVEVVHVRRRPAVGERDTRHPRNGGDAALYLVPERRHARRIDLSCRRLRQLRGHDVVRLEPEIDVSELVEADEQQCGDDQQRGRDRGWTATSARRANLTPALPVAVRPSARSSSSIDGALPAAGTMPKSATLEAPTPQSAIRSRRRLTSAMREMRGAVIPHERDARPCQTGADRCRRPASSALSTSRCRMFCARDARAPRGRDSRRRLATRATSRFDAFAHAMSHTSPTHASAIPPSRGRRRQYVLRSRILHVARSSCATSARSGRCAC